MEPVKAAIIYYSATGTVHALARAAAEGASPRKRVSGAVDGISGRCLAPVI